MEQISIRTSLPDVGFKSAINPHIPQPVTDTKTVENNTDKFTLHTLNSIEDITRFESQWRQLEEKVAKPTNVFQSYDWCMNWVKSCTIGNDCYGIHIITVSQNGQCLLIWPMMTTCSGPFQIMRWLSEPYSQYGDVLAINDERLDTILDLAWQQLNSHPFVDSIRFRHVRNDATIASFLQNNARNDSHADSAPYLEMEKYPTEASYEARYNRSQRRRRNRIRKNFEKLGTINFSLDNKGVSFARTLKSAIKEKRTWLSERGLYSKPVMSEEIEVFFSKLAQNGKTVSTVASSLTAGEQQISYEIGLRYKNHHFGYITAHDAKLTNESPGRLHMDLSQRKAIKDGMKVFDLMVPADPHKTSWSSNAMHTRDYFTHLNTRGAIYTSAYLKAARPLVRWLYLKAPPIIRRHITRFVS